MELKKSGCIVEIKPSFQKIKSQLTLNIVETGESTNNL